MSHSSASSRDQGPSPTAPSASSSSPELRDRRVLVALGGGIAAFKVATVVSQLVQSGASVRVLMTESATRFITPLTLQSLSGHPVLTSIWQSDDRPDAQHVGIARWADLFIIAPGTADLIAKIAAGIADDVVCLTACALPRTTPVLMAPAMNADMWANPIVQRNMATLRDVLNYRMVGPEEGWQACRTSGAGRMSEPAAIVTAAKDILAGLPRK